MAAKRVEAPSNPALRAQERVRADQPPAKDKASDEPKVTSLTIPDIAPERSWNVSAFIISIDIMLSVAFVIVALKNPSKDPFLPYYIIAGVISLDLVLIALLHKHHNEEDREKLILYILIFMSLISILAVIFRFVAMFNYCSDINKYLSKYGGPPYGLESLGNYMHYIIFIAGWFFVTLITISKLLPSKLRESFKWMVIAMVWMITCRILWYVVEQQC